MFFFARGHRLTTDGWFYHGRSARLEDERAVLARLKEINARGPICCCDGGEVAPREVVYGRIKRAISSRGGREYSECTLRARRPNSIVEIAFGNAVVGISKAGKAGGFVMFRC